MAVEEGWLLYRQKTAEEPAQLSQLEGGCSWQQTPASHCLKQTAQKLQVAVVVPVLTKLKLPELLTRHAIRTVEVVLGGPVHRLRSGLWRQYHSHLLAIVLQTDALHVTRQIGGNVGCRLVAKKGAQQTHKWLSHAQGQECILCAAQHFLNGE